MTMVVGPIKVNIGRLQKSFPSCCCALIAAFMPMQRPGGACLLMHKPDEQNEVNDGQQEAVIAIQAPRQAGNGGCRCSTPLEDKNAFQDAMTVTWVALLHHMLCVRAVQLKGPVLLLHGLPHHHKNRCSL